MPPVPEEAFASEFRSLSGTDRTEFVAGLWAARGWETTVADGLVVAERDGGRRRIRAVDPGRFGTPDLEGVDTLVVDRDRDRVRRAASEAGVEYVPPADLRELLLYGIERPSAESLYTEWFGRPLVRTVEDTGRVQSLAAVGASLSSDGRSRRFFVTALVLIVAVLVLAGPMLSGGDSAAQPQVTVGNVTPGTADAGGLRADTPTGTAIPTMAPGLSEAGVVDVAALTRAHVDGVSNRSRTVQWTLSAPPNESSGRSVTARNATAWIEDPTQYRFENVATVAVPIGSFDVRFDRYADGERVYERATYLERTTYSRAPVAEKSASSIDATVHSVFDRYFAGAENTVVQCAIKYNTDCPTYRVEVVGEAPDTLSANASEYEALAIVSDSGVVTTVRVQYTVPNGDGGRAPVSFTLDYRFEEVDVSPPDWLSQARNTTATASNTTATASNTTATTTVID